VGSPRYLARRSEDGYTASPSQALLGEPEAVSDDEQQFLTERSRRKAVDERVRRRQATAAEIEREIEYIDSRGRFLRRELKRLKR
jgi:transposase